jgi:predicted nucleic acid-binding protein
VNGHLLDTSVLIAHDPAAAERLPATAAISVVTLGELHAGVLLARDEPVREGRRRRLAAVRAAFAALDVDEAVAERYGSVLATARAQGRAAKATDLLIIATAAVHARMLFTLDVAQARLAAAAGVPVETA